jgi:uncharacterized protein YciI
MTVTVTHPGPEGHRSFLVQLTPGREGWPEHMTEAEQQALSTHAGLLESYCAKGLCVVAGPALDAQLGIAIWDGLTLEELLQHLEGEDPMVVNGFFHAAVRAMRVSFER